MQIQYNSNFYLGSRPDRLKDRINQLLWDSMDGKIEKVLEMKVLDTLHKLTVTNDEMNMILAEEIIDTYYE